MSEIRKLKAQVRKNAEKKPIEFRAVLGRADGTVKADAENVYVTLFNGEVITVYNERLPFVPYRKIIIGYEDDETLLQVLRFDNVYTSRPHPSLPNHKDSHSWFGYDPIEVYPEQFMALLPRAIGGMVVRVHGGDYYCNSIDCLLNTIDIDLTDEIPAAGAEWVNVEVDENKLLSFTHGANKPARELLLPADKPARTTGKQLLFSAKMYVGMTEFAQTKKTNDIFDPRFVNGYSSGGGSSTWGAITGTLSNQFDLQTALDAKAPVEIVESGFPDPSEITYTFVAGTRVFSLIPVGASYTVWVNHTERVYTTTKTITIANTTGLHFIYLDDDDALHEQLGFTDTLILDKTLVFVISWNATDGVALIEGSEWHGLMQASVHAYLHKVLHAQWVEGGAITATADGSGDVASHAQIAVSNGRFLDEDLPHVITDGSPQDISPVAKMPIYYRSGASDWKKLAATDYIVTTTGSGRAAYNLLTGGSWSLAEVTNNQYTLVHVFWTNDERHPTVIILGQNMYSTVANARAGATVEQTNLSLGGFVDLGPEWVAIGTLIIQTSNSYANAVKSRVRTTDTGGTYIDWRETKFAGSPGGGVDEAPVDGTPYARQDAGWVAAISGGDKFFLDARLTLETGVPVSLTNQLAKTNLYLTIYKGDQLALYSSGAWVARTLSTDLSIKATDAQTGTTTNGNKIISGLTDTSQLVAGMTITGTNVGAASVIATIDSATQVTGTVNSTGSASNTITFKLPASKIFDVFAYDNAGTPKLDFSIAWYSDLLRFNGAVPYATLLPKQNGVMVKSTDGTNIDATRRYIGSIGTTSTAGELEYSTKSRLVYNFYNQVDAEIQAQDTGAYWLANLNGAWAEVRNGSTLGTSRVSVLVGVAENVVSLTAGMVVFVSVNPTYHSSGIGIDSTTVNSAIPMFGYSNSNAGTVSSCAYNKPLAFGRHVISWLVFSSVNENVYFWTTQGSLSSGMSGTIKT